MEHKVEYDDSFYSATFGKNDKKPYGNKIPADETLSEIREKVKLLQSKLLSMGSTDQSDEYDDYDRNSSQTISDCIKITNSVMAKLNSLPESPYDVQFHLPINLKIH
jgi:hypothetical protein